MLFYGAAETILGIAVGVLVRHANAAPENDRAAVAAAIQTLWHDLLAVDVIAGVGAVAWAVGVIAAAIAVRQAEAPLAASILLALSAIALLHGPPTGPIGLACFAAAVVVLAVTSARSAPVG